MPASESLGVHIEAIRRRMFVGRGYETALFRTALTGEERARVFFIYGPGGTGKTALLSEFAAMASESGLTCAAIDAREVEPSPAGFLDALRRGLRLGEGEEWLNALERIGRVVVLVDGFESLELVDFWLRREFVPRLPADSLLVLAGRRPPSHEWRTDQALRELARAVSLRNLDREESDALLARRGVPRAHREAALAVSHGQPLALLLYADLLTQDDSLRAPSLADHPDIVRTLLERFLDSVPTSEQRAALEVCAVARVTTEAMLADLIGAEGAREAFAWLLGLSFIELTGEGVAPHDLARDVLQADMRWRDDAHYRQVYSRVREYTLQRVAETTGPRQQGAMFDTLFLHKRSPLMKPYFDWTAFSGCFIEPASEADHAFILEALRTHEGEEPADIASWWLQRQPAAFQVWRRAGGQPEGFMAHLLLAALDPQDLEADPAVRGIWSFVQHTGGLRRGESILIHRFWMSREAHQDTAAQSVIAGQAGLRWLTTPHLAWSFPCVADTEHWAPMFAYCEFTREPTLDFTVGGHRYGVFVHDWRRQPPPAWLNTLEARELDESLTLERVHEASPPPLVVLAEPDFATAVRDAYRDYVRLDALARNPLARSRLVAGSAEPAVALQAALRLAAESLRESPRDEKFHGALWRTFIQRAPTQEAAAEALGLPFSTYRYRLAQGVLRATAWLWDREIADVPVS